MRRKHTLKREVEIKKGLRLLPIRPVYLASMADRGKKNIITIGMFAFFSGTPSLVGIGISPKRHSYELICRSREFVVNIPTRKLMKAVSTCGSKSGRDIDKFEVAKLTPVKGTKVNAPLIKECPVNIECRVVKEVETGDHVWFIGEVVATHAEKGYNWRNGLLFKWIGENGFFYRVGERIGQHVEEEKLIKRWCGRRDLDPGQRLGRPT